MYVKRRTFSGEGYQDKRGEKLDSHVLTISVLAALKEHKSSIREALSINPEGCHLPLSTPGPPYQPASGFALQPAASSPAA